MQKVLDQSYRIMYVLSTVWVYSHFMAFSPTLFLWGVFGWSGVLASVVMASPKLVPLYMNNRVRMYRSFKPIVLELGAFATTFESLRGSLSLLSRLRGFSGSRS